MTHPTAVHPPIIPPPSPWAADPDARVCLRPGRVVRGRLVLITSSRETGQPELQMSLSILRDLRCQSQRQAYQNPQHSKLYHSDRVSSSIIIQECGIEWAPNCQTW